MNRVYVTTKDGRVFYAQQDSDFFYLLDSNESNINNVKIKRLSSCPWCFWSISYNLNLYLFVYLLDTPFEHQEVTYENQRRYNPLNINAFTDKLLPTDRFNFSSREGDVNLPKEGFKLPSNNWTWKSEWSYELNASDGWEYAVDFPSTYHSNLTRTSFVRRRKWTRNRLFTTYHQFIKIENPSVNEFVLDISVGGWSIPFTEKGFLSVWTVTNLGRLYFRKNVSHSNLEGDNWIKIKLPIGLEALSCSCSSRGDLWVITDQGNALMRTGISRENPHGIGWSSVDAATNVSGLREISLSHNTVWALDNQSQTFYRSGVTDRCLQGVKWVFIPSHMNNLSCSLSGQLWAVNLLENKIFFRFGIDEENLSGTGWKTINLKYKLTNHRKESQESINQEVTQDSVSVSETSIIETPCVTEEFIESSIYDEEVSIYEANTDSKPNETKNEQTKETNQEININKYKNHHDVELLGKQVQQTNRDLDEYIETLIKRDEAELIKTSRSDSILTISFTEESLDSKSNSDDMHRNLFFEDIDIHSVCINSFNTTNIPIKWYDKEIDVKKFKLNSKWREGILNDLIKRNLKEFLNIDKISCPYENDTTWSLKEKFQILFKNKLVPCLLEIIHSSVSIKQSCILIHIISKSKVVFEHKIHFENILLIKPYVIEKKRSLPCFVIYLNSRESFIFLASSKSQQTEWLNQISIYASKVNSFDSLAPTFTCVTKDGYSYYLHFNCKDEPIYLSQIDGHFKQVEKHSSGFTYGCGENGKLWFLDCANNVVQDNYKGPYVQSDELEIYTYENQRWNLLSGLFNSKSGFTKIGLPTDRYPWSDETGKIRRRKEECQLPSSMFEWSSNWQIDFSLQPGVDKEGWQYAVDFPTTYYAVCNPVKHFVRRRRWVRKCRIVSNGLWKEISQSHKLTCISVDQERNSKKMFLNKDEMLFWATDSYGCVLSALVNDSNPNNIKWKYVTCEHQSFTWVSIGPDLRIWSIDINGNVYIRAGVSRDNGFCGTSWTRINFDENEIYESKLEQLSVGKYCVWAISQRKEIYFRENISKSFPEGTSWIKIDSNFKYVTVNSQNHVYAITSETASDPNVVMYREGVSLNCPKGTFWKKILTVECKMISNRGYSKLCVS